MRQWTDPLTVLPGIGEKTRLAMVKFGIENLGDLASHYPRGYIDQSDIAQMCDVRVGDETTLVGLIMAADEQSTRSGKYYLSTTISDGTGYLTIAWWGQRWLARQLTIGRRLLVTGVIARNYGLKQGLTVNPVRAWELLGPSQDAYATHSVLPMYPSTGAYSQTYWRNSLRKLFDDCPPIVEFLPQRLRGELQLMSREAALHIVHGQMPAAEDGDDGLTAMELVHAARRRLAFDELFLIQCGLLLMKQQSRSESGRAIQHGPDGELGAAVMARLPFALTADQARAYDEIRRDMESAQPMRRLLQGDVGSGKTAVALLALVKTVASGHQGVIMAPTEILARQHFATFTTLLAGTGVRVLLLTGQLKAKERRQALAAIAEHQADIIVGTHALIQKDVHCADLGLCVTDEQHRFGTEQRAALSLGAQSVPDVLAMTATPIPRTLTLTVYGDLDVSRIETLPPGRVPVRTFVRQQQSRRAVYDFVRGEILKGQQAYVVCPRIDLAEDDDFEGQQSLFGHSDALRSTEEVFDELSRGVFRDIACACVHGKMNPRDKERVMADFRAGEVKLLVSTTVIEVGVDVPNATCMVIENAERFGLAQLHQLRGRIGRGALASYCVLISGSHDAETLARLRLMEQTSNGFALAEEDLRERGPGQFFGSMQHGLGDLKIANALRDLDLLKAAQSAAGAVLADRDCREVVLTQLPPSFQEQLAWIVKN